MLQGISKAKNTCHDRKLETRDSHGGCRDEGVDRSVHSSHSKSGDHRQGTAMGPVSRIAHGTYLYTTTKKFK